MYMTVSTVVGQVPRPTRKPSRTSYTTTFNSTRTSLPSHCARVVLPGGYTCRVSHRQTSGSPPPVHTAATIFQKFCYDNKDALSAGIIVAGWDKEVGPSVYNIPLGGGLFKQPWAIGGSGSTYVYGYCDATYQEGWDRDQTVEFVKNSTSSFTALLLSCDADRVYSTCTCNVSRRFFGRRHPHVRDHGGRGRATVRPWGPAAEVLAREGDPRLEL